jgi:hypothetical protein
MVDAIEHGKFSPAWGAQNWSRNPLFPVLTCDVFAIGNLDAKELRKSLPNAIRNWQFSGTPAVLVRR